MTPYTFFGDESVSEEMDFPKIPEGERFLKVIDFEDAGTTKNNDPMIKLVLEDTATKITMWHWLMLFPAGSKAHGMTKRQLHVLLNKPVDGELEVEPSEFLGRIFKADIYYEKAPNGKEYPRFNVSTMQSLGDNVDSVSKEEELEPIPFD